LPPSSFISAFAIKYGKWCNFLQKHLLFSKESSFSLFLINKQLGFYEKEVVDKKPIVFGMGKEVM